MILLCSCATVPVVRVEINFDSSQFDHMRRDIDSDQTIIESVTLGWVFKRGYTTLQREIVHIADNLLVRHSSDIDFGSHISINVSERIAEQFKENRLKDLYRPYEIIQNRLEQLRFQYPWTDLEIRGLANYRRRSSLQNHWSENDFIRAYIVANSSETKMYNLGE